ncbi:MAG: MBL fold metallo-hydrolase [Gemmatimonadetes bacterium]|nr:MBL fold metallo-hydrolase [Gemmatimonadota bacterium]
MRRPDEFEMEARELERAEREGFRRPPVEPRPAAAVILGRDSGRGPEVLLVRRRTDLLFAGGAYVFPGGTLDPEDSDPLWREHSIGWEAHGADVAPFAVAACRELFEEAGVLLALGPGGSSARPPPLPSSLPSPLPPSLPPSLRPPAVRQMRAALGRGRSFLELLSGAGLRLDLSRVALFSRWITPVPLSRRYDARFFLAAAPEGAEVLAESGELVEHIWIRPGEALDRYGSGAFPMLFPTVTMLGWLRDCRSIRELAERARGKEVAPILPRLRRTASGVIPVLPGTREYVQGALNVVRAPNPGPLTLDGTCTYVVGGREVIVIDPGPADPAHLEAILRAIPSKVRVVGVAITHAHADHAEAAAPLAERLNVDVFASRDAGEKLGLGRVRTLEEGSTIEFDDGDALITLSTPGHSADHLCFLWREAEALFCGDLILGAGSAMIAPPDGEMAAYLDTLRRLRSLDLLVLYPGHGPPVEDPAAKIDEYVAHRLEREAQILDALRAGAVTIPEIRERVYGPLERALAYGAEANIEAHLTKLLAEGRVAGSSAGRYSIV